MPQQSCCVGPCHNKWWFAEKIVVRGHVKKLIFHLFPKDEGLKRIWVKQIAKGVKNFELTKGSYVCSNPFYCGKPVGKFNFPTKFLTTSDVTFKKSPKKRLKMETSISFECDSYTPVATMPLSRDALLRNLGA